MCHLTWENNAIVRFDFAQGETFTMPRTADRSRRELWQGTGDAWTMATELLTATAVWGAIGYGLDRAFGTWPILFVIGALVGHATGIYILWRRTQHMSERARARGARGSG